MKTLLDLIGAWIVVALIACMPGAIVAVFAIVKNWPRDDA